MPPFLLSVENAKEIISDAIVNSTKHQDYDRVCGFAKKYAQLITGEDQDNLLRQFVKREDDAMFTQRKEITQSVTSSMASSLMTPFQKIGKSNIVTKKIESNEKKEVEILEERVRYFYESENESNGLDYWLQTRYFELLFTDPNAFVVIEAEDFDPNKQQPWFYPYEVPSTQAINFKIINNDIKWLLDEKPIKYLNGDTWKDGFKYTLYFSEFALVYTRVGDDYKPINEDDEIADFEAKGKYLVNVFEYKLMTAPVIRIGYTRDVKTQGRTCVNPFHAAMPFFMKSIKTGSELDLTMSLHVFPQKYQYVQRCLGEGIKGCKNGSTNQGHTCSKCNGTGYEVHTSAQDAVYLPMPSDPSELIDIDKLAAYKYPPIDIIKFQDEILDKFEAKAHSAVFNSQALIKKGLTKTATEIDTNMESVYDALHLFGDKVSSVWLSIVDMIVSGLDLKSEFTLVHRYPSNLKMKSINELIIEKKSAEESNAPGFILERLSEDIAEQQFQDEPERLLAFKVKNRFNPFSGKSHSEIMYLMSSEYTSEDKKVLYANFDSIFQKLESLNENLYQLKPDKLEEMINKEVELLKLEIATKRTERFNALLVDE